MWLVSVKAAQSELDVSDGRPPRTKELRTDDCHERMYHHVTFLNLYNIL